jgi:tetratricopeptide (TPR) repeat protein
MPWLLERGSDLVVELHLAPRKTPAVVQPVVGLYFTSTPPVQVPVSGKLSSRVIDIPAGDPDYVVTDTFEIPVDVDLLSVYPHAHYLGKEMRATATLPNGQEMILLLIRQWSFHWQQDYRYVNPVPLPRGTRVTMRYTYDNSDANEENPRHPSVRVKLGSRSVDEMGELVLQVLPKAPADGAPLARAFEQHDQQVTLAGQEKRVRDEPNVAQNQSGLGALYLDAGRPADAIPPLETALRLDERLASAHSDLGTALMETGRLPEALAHLQRAAALAPRDENFQFNLGNALSEANRFPEAEAAFQRALALNPGFPDAHVNLGELLMRRGQKAEALQHYQQAVALVPDSPVTHSNLASALAASGRFTEAMQEARRALAINPGYGPALEIQRRLQAMGIR